MSTPVTAPPVPPAGTPTEWDDDRPKKRPSLTSGSLWELGGSLAAAFAIAIVGSSVLGRISAIPVLLVTILAYVPIYAVVVWRQHGVVEMKDRLARVYVWGGAAVALLPLVSIIFFIVAKGAPVAFDHFPAFFVHDMANAGPEDPTWKGGMGHAIIGSFEQVGLATLYTVPISILTATFLVDSDTRFSRFVRIVVDAMMGTPSIIAGLFVYLFWVQPRHTSGYSGFAASMALAVLMLPIMIRTAEEVIRVVPNLLREAALGLGSPRWRMIVRVVLPTARTGLITAVILGVALAVGETAPVLFTAHGTPRYNLNPFSGPQQNLPLQVFQLITSPYPNFVKDGFGGAFILVSLVLLLFVMARLLGSSNPGSSLLRFLRRR